MATADDHSAPPQAPKAPYAHKRTLKGYLVDRPFQLRYTGYVVGLTLLITLPLGYLLHLQTQKALGMGDDVAAIAASANEAAKEAQQQATLLNRRLEMEILLRLSDRPEQVEAMKKANQAETERIAARGAEVAQREQRLRSQRDGLAAQKRSLLTTLALSLALLVLLVGAAGVVFTHKVAGPIHRMRALFESVGDGRMPPPQSLRRGDELQGFFVEFFAMLDKLKQRRIASAKRLEVVIEAAGTAGAGAAVIDELRAARESLSAD